MQADGQEWWLQLWKPCWDRRLWWGDMKSHSLWLFNATLLKMVLTIALHQTSFSLCSAVAFFLQQCVPWEQSSRNWIGSKSVELVPPWLILSCYHVVLFLASNAWRRLHNSVSKPASFLLLSPSPFSKACWKIKLFVFFWIDVQTDERGQRFKKW